jgi:hypothetical protein
MTKLEEIKIVAVKMKNAKQYFNPFIENDWVDLPLLAQKFINDFGVQILKIVERKHKWKN